MRKILLIIISIILATGIVYFLNNFFKSDTVEAQAGSDVYGWAWSANIGWISFNCSNLNTCGTVNYGVKLDDQSNLSGYAWSKNIGWINFKPTGPYPNCPTTTCPSGSPNWSSRVDNAGKITGWARAVAAEGRSDGWDGWILFGPIVKSGVDYGSYINNNGDFYGWAWGGDVVGWISLNHANNGGNLYKVSFNQFVQPIEPTVTLNAPSVVQLPNTINLSWTSTNASSCMASGDWSGPKPLYGTSSIQKPQGTYTFTLSCGYGDRIASATRNVSVIEQGQVEDPPECSFRANPTKIIRGSFSSTLSWSCNFVDYCLIDQGIGFVQVPSGSKSVRPTTNTIYTLSCFNSAGSASYQVEIKVSDFEESNP